MIGGRAQHEIGIDELSLVAIPFFLSEARERCSVGHAGEREGVCPFSVGNSLIPVQPGPSGLESRHDLAELRMNGSAVVALVVILEDALPVGRNRVRDPAGRPELLQRIMSKSLG